jgi:hypothetical protein
MTSERAAVDETILEIQVEAHLQGHALEGFVLTEDERGYEAHCTRCGMSVWVGNNGVFYSLLEDSCPQAPNEGPAQ